MNTQGDRQARPAAPRHASAPRYATALLHQTEEREPGEEEIALAVETLKLLADNTRLRILWALLHGEHSVNNLAAHVGAQAPAVSQHLAKLRMARLVKSRREGNRMYYAARDAHVLRLVEEALFHAGDVVATPAPTRKGAIDASAR